MLFLYSINDTRNIFSPEVPRSSHSQRPADMMRPLLLLPLVVRVWALPPSWNGTYITDASYTNPPAIEITTMTAIANDLAAEKGVTGLELNYKVYQFTVGDHSTTPGELMVLRPKLANTPESEQTVHLAIRLGSRHEPWGVRYISNSYLNPIIGGQRATSHDDYVRTSTRMTPSRSPSTRMLPNATHFPSSTRIKMHMNLRAGKLPSISKNGNCRVPFNSGGSSGGSPAMAPFGFGRLTMSQSAGD